MIVISKETCAQAWKEVIKKLNESEDKELYDVVVEIADPLTLTAEDKAITGKMDSFLRRHNAMPLHTVANTIFPAGLFKSTGSNVAKVYAKSLDILSGHPDYRWGTYFGRMTHRVLSTGVSINPLDCLIEKLKSQMKRTGPVRAEYELSLIDPVLDLPTYDPEKDRNRPISGPCLSHISLKVGRSKRLHMTALYRSHYYIERALGNFIGLAQLQHFIASSCGLSSGPIVCFSTLATLDESANQKWKKADAATFMEELFPEPA